MDSKANKVRYTMGHARGLVDGLAVFQVLDGMPGAGRDGHLADYCERPTLGPYGQPAYTRDEARKACQESIDLRNAAWVAEVAEKEAAGLEWQWGGRCWFWGARRPPIGSLICD